MQRIQANDKDGNPIDLNLHEREALHLHQCMEQWFELAERHGVTIEKIKSYCQREVDDNWPVVSGKEEMEDEAEKGLIVGRAEFAVGLLNQINKWEEKKCKNID